MFEDALKYPTRGDDATTTILIGGGLSIAAFLVAAVGVVLSAVFVGLFLLPFAFVPGVLMQGYYVDVVRHRLDGEATPPTFTDWPSLFVDGLKAMLVGIAYALPALAGVVVTAIVAGGLSVAMRGSPNAGAGLGFLLTILAGLGLFIYGIAASYVLPAAIVNWVREDDLAAAFSLSTLKDVTIDSRYLIAWLFAVIVAAIGGIVGQALIVVFLVGFFVLFYVQVVVWYCYTEGYVDALGIDRQERTPFDDANDSASPASETVTSGASTAGETDEDVNGTNEDVDGTSEDVDGVDDATDGTGMDRRE